MILNLGGVPTDMPLYDLEGNLIQNPIEKEWFGEEVNEEVKNFQTFLSEMKELLSEVNNEEANLSISDDVNIYEFDDSMKEYYTVILTGGQNGIGSWSNYLKVLSDYLSKLEEKFEDAWIVKFNIDTLDDVFDVEIAVIAS